MLACLVFVVALLAPGRAMAARGPLAEFTVPASSGYTLNLRSERDQVRLTAYRETPPLAAASGSFSSVRESSYAAATYYARAEGDDPEAIAASLGPLGEVDVSFQPSGETRVVHLSHKGKTSGCLFPRRIVRRLGTFTGRVSFHGENGYTSADVSAAPGSVGTSPFRNCSTKPGMIRPEAIRGQAGPDVSVVASNPSSHVYFDASTVGPGDGFYANVTEPLSSGYIVSRTAEVHAAGALTLDPARHVATFHPPAPFSGVATYRGDAAHPWSGSLAVAFPGASVPLTGPLFKARMRLFE